MRFSLRRLQSVSPRFDFYLLLCAVLLLVFGLLVVWSTSPVLAGKQLGIALGSLGLFLAVSLIDYRRYLPTFSPFIFLGTLVMLVLTLIIGHYVRGASRWLGVGAFSFQPSEMAKLSLILGLAWLHGWRRIDGIWGFLLSLGFLMICAVLVFLQPDLGTAIILFAIWLGVSFIAGTPLIHFLILAFLGLLSLPIGWHFLADYQRQRVFAFLNPGADPLGAGYNILQAVMAIGSGMFWGRGLGRGPQSQLRFLPERSTDFIFASLAEEWGLIGVVILLTLFLILFFRIRRAAEGSNSDFGFLVGYGVLFMLLSQMVINVGMNLGMMPVTGLPLPLISAGGSSLVVTLVSLGLVESIVRHRS